jgi:EryCIII-like glycosyltransferase
MSIAWFHPNVAESAAAIVEFARTVLESARPDVVVADQLPQVVPVVRAAGVPLCQITHGPLFPGHGPWPHWVDRRPEELRYPPAFAQINEVLAGAGLPPTDADDALSGELLVAPTPEELGTGPGALHVDAGDGLPGGHARPRFARRAQRPLVAISPGPALFTLLPELVRAVELAAGDAVVLDAAGSDLGDGVQVHGPVDIAAAFAQVDAVLHQGGSGTAAACLVAGIGSVVVPTYTEQEFNGRALAAAGAGVVVPMREAPLEPMQVADGIRTLVHRRPEALAERIAAALEAVLAAPRPQARTLPPVGSAADALEELAG